VAGATVAGGAAEAAEAVIVGTPIKIAKTTKRMENSPENFNDVNEPQTRVEN
jgi:hypothetical protein